jgi:hypothetical protein
VGFGALRRFRFVLVVAFGLGGSEQPRVTDPAFAVFRTGMLSYGSVEAAELVREGVACIADAVPIEIRLVGIRCCGAVVDGVGDAVAAISGGVSLGTSSPTPMPRCSRSKR